MIYKHGICKPSNPEAGLWSPPTVSVNHSVELATGDTVVLSVLMDGAGEITGGDISLCACQSYEG